MMWSRNLICKAFVIMLLSTNSVMGRYIAVKVGLYDFTSEVSRDFYSTTPLLLVGTNIFEMARLEINFSAGMAYNKISYSDSKHTLNMYPAFVTMVYNLPNVGSRVQPYFGSGLGFLAKFDKNEMLPNPHINYTYGYHILAGLKTHLKKRYSIAFTMQYNSFTPSNTESINVSGVIHTLELRYNLGKLLKTTNK